MVYWSFKSSATLPISLLARSGAVLTVTSRQVVCDMTLECRRIGEIEKARVLGVSERLLLDFLKRTTMV